VTDEPLPGPGQEAEQMNETKRFHISDLLSVVPGAIVSTRHMDGVYDILNWMTRDDLFTHQLPRAARECEPHLLRQFPWLADASMDTLEGLLENVGPDKDARKAACDAWWNAQARLHGEWHEVARIPQDDHDRIDPIAEAEAMMPGKVIVVKN
jgi:hypothetical protein